MQAKIEDLDLHWLLPVLFDGLREEEEPYKFIAKEGVLDVLENGGDRILPVVPQLIVPIKNALNTRRHRVMCVMLKMLQKLVTADVDEEGNGLIGRALVPFYRQILPVLNLFYTKSKNIGDEIDYAQRKEENLGELIQETLQLLEVYGGEDVRSRFRIQCVLCVPFLRVRDCVAFRLSSLPLARRSSTSSTWFRCTRVQSLNKRRRRRRQRLTCAI